MNGYHVRLLGVPYRTRLIGQLAFSSCFVRAGRAALCRAVIFTLRLAFDFITQFFSRGLFQSKKCDSVYKIFDTR